MKLAETITIATPECFYCRGRGSVKVSLEGFKKRQFGALIQDAYPELSIGLREQLMTGTHPDCWNAAYGIGK